MTNDRCRALLAVLLTVGTATLAHAQAPAPSVEERCAEALWERAEDIELPVVAGEAEEEPASKIVYGESAEFAGGSLRTYARMTGPCDPPAAIGIEMSANLQEDLPGPEGVSMQPPPACATDPTTPGCFMPFEPFFLDFFEQEAPGWNPFPVMEADWSPMGHDPPPVYGAPHWDLHFYLTPESEVMSIAPGGPCSGLSPADFAKAHASIPEQCFPQGFANMNALAPLMGNHYVDMTSPEFQALAGGRNAVAAWNETWIFGGFGGKITFFEAMIKRGFLEQGPSQCRPIPGLPTEFAIEGYKPSTYCVVLADNATMIELRDFTWYDSACTSGDPAPASFLSLPPGSPPLPAECVAPKMAGAEAPAPAPAAVPAPAPSSGANSLAAHGISAALLAAGALLLLVV